MLEFFEATINFKLPPVRQCAATAFANVMKTPAFTNGGQHGVIAEDRFPDRAEAKEGTPSSNKNLILVITCIGGTLSRKLLLRVPGLRSCHDDSHKGHHASRQEYLLLMIKVPFGKLHPGMLHLLFYFFTGTGKRVRLHSSRGIRYDRGDRERINDGRIGFYGSG